MGGIFMGNNDIAVSISSQTSYKYGYLNKCLIITDDAEVPFTKLDGATADTALAKLLSTQGVTSEKLTKAINLVISQVDNSGITITPEYVYIIGKNIEEGTAIYSELFEAIEEVTRANDFYCLVPLFEDVSFNGWFVTYGNSKKKTAITYTTEKLKAFLSNQKSNRMYCIYDGESSGEVEFKNVYFCYPDADEAVLHNISFTAPAGKTTAFIGSTGSGKSTLINLIPRFFDVSRGSILVDGVDIRDVKQHDLCEKIGYVPQKGVLFSGTIESNLKYGKEDATIDEVKRAARIAQATDFIEEKEEKYDSPIAQGGSNVSGGQKQRLSIARAIAKDPEIYIFDDSFSALDYKTDVKLRSELQKETNGSTTLIVAQRISTILHADQIIVLDEGNIVGKGTHEELLNTCPVYQQIAKSQLSEDDLKKAREVSDHE